MKAQAITSQKALCINGISSNYSHKILKLALKGVNRNKPED